MSTVPERLARLETQMDHFREAQDRAEAKQDRAEAKLDSVVEALTAAKGGWKVVAFVGPIATGLISWAAAHFGIPKIG